MERAERYLDRSSKDEVVEALELVRCMVKEEETGCWKKVLFCADQSRSGFGAAAIGSGQGSFHVECEASLLGRDKLPSGEERRARNQEVRTWLVEEGMPPAKVYHSTMQWAVLYSRRAKHGSC
jgi:hypothetical protein